MSMRRSSALLVSIAASVVAISVISVSVIEEAIKKPHPKQTATTLRPNPGHTGVCVRLLVPRKGLEPPRLAAPEPKSGASTNSATWAHVATGRPCRTARHDADREFYLLSPFLSRLRHAGGRPFRGPAQGRWTAGREPATRRAGAESHIAGSLCRYTPVASWPSTTTKTFPLLPSCCRRPCASRWRRFTGFARSADDFADEGDLSPDQRRALLAAYQAELDAIEQDRPTLHPVFLRLRPVIAQYQLAAATVSRPARCLYAGRGQGPLPRFRRTDGLLPPLGRSGRPPAAASVRPGHAGKPVERSDAICSALQLINHWQDVAIDADKGANGRIYLPQDEMARFDVSDDDDSSPRCWQTCQRRPRGYRFA